MRSMKSKCKSKLKRKKKVQESGIQGMVINIISSQISPQIDVAGSYNVLQMSNRGRRETVLPDSSAVHFSELTAVFLSS